jgi:hypothetical protein
MKGNKESLNHGIKRKAKNQQSRRTYEEPAPTAVFLFQFQMCHCSDPRVKNRKFLFTSRIPERNFRSLTQIYRGPAGFSGTPRLPVRKKRTGGKNLGQEKPLKTEFSGVFFLTD